MKKNLCTILIPFIAFVFVQTVAAGEWKSPEDFEKAQAEAEEALQRTGPNSPRSVETEASSVGVVETTEQVTGLEAGIDRQKKDVETNIVSVDQAMMDLDAKVIQQAIVIDLASDVLFDFDKFTIKPEAATTLSKVAVLIREKARGDVLIEGHTDAKGTEAYNQVLSEKRAKAVKKWLIKEYGIRADILKTKGWGEQKPIAPNTKKDGSDNPEGRARNRRVVITISIVK